MAPRCPSSPKCSPRCIARTYKCLVLAMYVGALLMTASGFGMVEQFALGWAELPQNTTAPPWLEEGVSIKRFWIAAVCMFWGSMILAMCLLPPPEEPQEPIQLHAEGGGRV
jgi:hypothetical protein